MNDNQEKNTSADEGKETPVIKKFAKFSAFIYLGLAITVVIVATVGIFSISYDYEQSLEPISFPEVGFTNDDYSKPQIVITPDDLEKPNISDSPVINDESGVSPDVSMPAPDNSRVMFYNPVDGEIVKGYSMDALVFSETMRDYRVHSGVDIEAEIGTDVLCFTDGTVATIVDDYFYGTTVSVTHADGLVSYYMNLDNELAENIAVGSEVLAGQKLGKVGNTARCENAEPSHLHFELRITENLVDPTEELPK